MATGRIASWDPARQRGVVSEKGKNYPFGFEDLLEGVDPAVKVEVAFDKKGDRAVHVRPKGSAAPPKATADVPTSTAAPRPAARTRTDATFESWWGHDAPTPLPAPARHGWVNAYSYVSFPESGVARRPLPTFGGPHLRVGGVRARLDVSIRLLTPASISPVPGPDAAGLPTSYVRRLPDGRAWIPGSAVKGPVRVVAEVLSRSCMPVFDGTRSISYRPVAPAKPGWLIRTGQKLWTLHPTAHALGLPPQGTVSGAPGSVTIEERGKVRRNFVISHSGGERGEWVIHEAQPDTTKKRHQFFLEPDNRRVRAGQSFVIDSDLIAAADLANHAGIEEDNDALKNATDPKHKALEVTLDGVLAYRARRRPYAHMAIGERRPVWYGEGLLDRETTVMAIGPVALHRVAHSFDGRPVTMDEVARRSSALDATSPTPCEHQSSEELLEHGLCAACELFGFVSPALKIATGLRGRVRFDPLHTAAPVNPRAPVILSPLSNPKYSQTFSVIDPTHRDVAESYSWSNPGVRLRGRKMYWHQPHATEQTCTIEGTHLEHLREKGVTRKQLRAVELLPAGTSLSGSIVLDGLSEAEAGLVVLSLDPSRLGRARPGTPELAMHLGGGKPLGLGSCRITIDGVTNMTAATRYASFATDGYDSDPTQLDRWVDAACREYGLLEPRNDLDDLLRLLCFDPEIGQAVTRPPGKPNAWESFAWFSDHAKRGKRGQPSAAPPARVDVLRTAEETASGLRQQS